MANKEAIIVAFLKEVAKIYDPMPDKQEVHIPYGFKRGLYQTFLEFWIHEVEGGINGKVSLMISFLFAMSHIKICEILFFLQVMEPPSEQYFLRVWKNKVPWLKCRSYHKFMMCDECVSLNDRIRTARTMEEASFMSFLLVSLCLTYYLIIQKKGNNNIL
jgi:hypothetical protein